MALLLRSLRGPRPLPGIHRTPVEPPFFSCKVKSLSLRARVRARPCRWALDNSRFRPLQHGGLLQLHPCEHPGVALASPHAGRWWAVRSLHNLQRCHCLRSPHGLSPAGSPTARSASSPRWEMAAVFGDKLSLRDGIAPPGTTQPKATIMSLASVCVST